MQKTDPLIRTKLRLPITRPGQVSRPRLHELITRGLFGPLTLVAAPAGFGKTTLVASSVSQIGMPIAWVSLDKNDNQAGRFLTYLVAALQAADRRIGSEAVQLMGGLQQASPEAVLTSLINDIDSAGADMVVVLDDYQFITSQAVSTDLTFLLDHCPRNLHLLIATRSDPPLPLARLRARGQLVELRAADLRFTPAEASQFLNDIMGLHLDAGAVAALEERTEGWIAGLQMAGIALQGKFAQQATIAQQSTASSQARKDTHWFIEGFSGTNRFILDYLLEEVLASQPPEIQRFLLYTSILDRLTAPLCDALMTDGDTPAPGSGGAPSDHRLKYLERENLFLVQFDDRAAAGGASFAERGATWYRYHHLFSDLLRARLQQTYPDLAPRLHIQASTWLEQNGFISEAIQHLCAAQEIDRAADLIERYGPAFWAESDLSVVQMADSLPREMLLERPKIGIYHAWLLINQGVIEKAYPLLNDLAQKLAGSELNPEQRWIYTVVRLALAFLIPPSSPHGLEPLPDDQLLDEIPADEEIMRDAADILYGMTLGRRGEFDRAAEFSVQSIQRKKALHGATSHTALAIPNLVPFLATIHMFQGHLHAAFSLSHEYLDLFKEKGIRVSSAGNLDVVIGGVLYEWNRLEEAERTIRDGLRANEPWGNIMTDAFGLLALANVLQAKGDYSGALQVVEKFETRLQAQSRPREFGEDFRTLRIRVQLASGDLQTAFRWADQVILSDDFRRYQEYYRLTLARVRLAQERYGDVAEILTGVTSENLPGNRISRQIEIYLILAAAVAENQAVAAQQRLPEALRIIDACLALAEPEGYIRVFLSAGEPARKLLAAYLRLDAPVHKLFAEKVLDAFLPSQKTEHSGPQAAGLIEPLSSREIEVLQLMALGKTNQEIAMHLIVALGTIKAHAASIYRKLDAANRTEAVAHARQLGILP